MDAHITNCQISLSSAWFDELPLVDAGNTGGESVRECAGVLPVAQVVLLCVQPFFVSAGLFCMAFLATLYSYILMRKGNQPH